MTNFPYCLNIGVLFQQHRWLSSAVSPLTWLQDGQWSAVSFSQNFFALFAFLIFKICSLTCVLCFFAGLHRYAITVPAFGFAGKWMQDYRDQKLAMKDAVMRDYISKNVEFFELPRKSNVYNRLVYYLY